MNYADPSGRSFIAAILIGTVVGGLISFGIDVGKQLINNNNNYDDVDLGSAVNSGIVGAALGFSLAAGVATLGPAIAGTAVSSGLSAGGAFALSAGVSFAAGALGYASEERMNDREPSLDKAIAHGGFVALEGMVKYGVGGMIGSVGNIGTKGKFLTSIEWWGKLILGLEFAQPLKTGIDYLRKTILSN